MHLRVLVIPDKFKGTLTARQAAETIARGWHSGRPADELDLLPMSDGGDGFGEVMGALLAAVPRKIKTCDAAHRPCTARWWWQARSKTAMLDTAGVVGLAMLPHRRYHPFELDTFGLGLVLEAALKFGARRCLIGLGGSATNDGGFGLARALGWRFLDRSGRRIKKWIDLADLSKLIPPEHPPRNVEFVIAVDVQNPLLGPHGASRIYGPQKGLEPGDFAAAERALRNLARAAKNLHGSDLARLPGSGAAGGLGFGFCAFLPGQLVHGFELFARESKLESKMRRADLVITGEGGIDRSTAMGKGAGCVAALARKLGIPCIGLSGALDRNLRSRKTFTHLAALTELTGVALAKAQPRIWLERLAKRVASEWRV
jgi:glycerate kinase